MEPIYGQGIGNIGEIYIGLFGYCLLLSILFEPYRSIRPLVGGLFTKGRLPNSTTIAGTSDVRNKCEFIPI
jgi:hypothetical protein